MMNVQKIMVALSAVLLFASVPVWAATTPKKPTPPKKPTVTATPTGSTNPATATNPTPPAKPTPPVSNIIPGSMVAPITDSTKWNLRNYGEDKVKVALLESEYPTAIKIKVDAVDDVAWHARVDCEVPDELKDGEIYTLKYRAKADSMFALSTYGQLTDGDVHGIGLASNITLGTDWKTFTDTFIVSKSSGHKTLLSFNVGYKPGIVWIASVSLIKGANTSIKEPVADPANWVLEQKLPMVLRAVPEADSIKFIISSVSSRRWEAQAYQAGFSPVGGSTYQITFTAKSDSPRSMDVTMIDVETRQLLGFKGESQLTTAWKVYTFQYDIPAGYHGLARVPNFTLGDKVGVVWVRNLSYTRVH